MTVYDPLSDLIAFEDGELPFSGILRLFSHLVQTGQAWTLQGVYGCLARDLIAAGWLDSKGVILSAVEDATL